MVECKTENLKEANLDRYVSLLQDIDSKPENDPSNPGINPLKSCESSSEKPATWTRNYGLRNTLKSLEKSPERSPEKSHGWFKPIENQSEEKAIKVEVTDDLGAKYLVFSPLVLREREEKKNILHTSLVVRVRFGLLGFEY